MTLWMFSLAVAKCISGTVTATPVVQSPTSEIVVVAYGSERATVDGVDRFALRGPTGTVPLTVVETLRGDFRDDQWVLRPTQPLAPGSYRLQLDGSPQAEAITVGDAAAAEPRWMGMPSVGQSFRQEMGCGPAVTVRIDVPVVEAPWVEVILSHDGAEPVRGRLPVVDGAVTVGHGMCSGFFELEEGARYDAVLTAIGGAGQRVDGPRGVSFVAP